VRTLEVHRLGRVEYADGLRLMDLAAERLRAGDPPGTDHLFLVEHPPLFTLGRGAGAANVLAAPDWLERNGFELHATSRGGDVTYHGPGQIVAYPVVDLSDRRDVRKFVGALEEAMIRCCADLGLEAGRHPRHRGAWIGARKVGAVGVHLSRWITSHGLAFNLAPDLSHYRLIVPCGIADPGLSVTSLARELEERGRPAPGRREVEQRLAGHLAEALGRRTREREVDLHTVSVVPLGAGGRVLLLLRSEAGGGFWQPVTGRVEPGETPLGAAQRELAEEIGADAEVRPLGYVHAFALEPVMASRLGGGLRLAREEAFAARLPAGFEPRLGEEHVAWGWYDVAEAMPLLRYAGLRRAVRMAGGSGA
jgi:lipoyl(octanoyl) transferase